MVAQVLWNILIREVLSHLSLNLSRLFAILAKLYGGISGLNTVRTGYLPGCLLLLPLLFADLVLHPLFVWWHLLFPASADQRDRDWDATRCIASRNVDVDPAHRLRPSETEREGFLVHDAGWA